LRLSALEGSSMRFRSLVLRGFALALAAAFIVSACSSGDHAVPLSQVEPIDIPVADIDNQTNQNINNPTLTIPATFQVSDGDLLTLIWSDEFDGAQLDPEVWFYESGDGTQYGIPFPAWGNNELEYYLPDNVQLANGALQITARRESAAGYNFTSGRINTQDRFAFKYGRIEASIKFPSGQGLWPAFWMLPQDSPYGVWPASGEIDIVEAINLDGTGGNEIFSTIHFGDSAETRYTPSFDVTDDFHTYAFEWDEFEMRWYVDGTLYKVENFWSSTAAPYPAPFDQPFHILFNLAVGGNFPGSPNGSTPLPATLEVDWVRVYSGEEPPVDPADPGTIPDDVIYASDPNEIVDIVFGVDYTDFTPFGSGSVFDGEYAGDADFSPAFAVTTGNGYGAQVGQVGFLGFAAGFATGYATLDFKAKGLNNDLIRVKFLDAGDYLDITLSNSVYSTDLGNGWYQVSVPITDFSGVDTATGLLFETDGSAPAAFRFLLTDLGFSGTAGGGGGGDTVLVTFDEAMPPAVTAFGASIATIEAGPAGGSGNALKIDRNNGDAWAGAWVAITPIPSDAGAQTVSARVYSPTAGIRMVAKAEFGENAGTGDTDANEAVVVGWQTLSWTFNGLDPNQSYNRFTMLPNLPNVDDLDYFYDDITLLAGSGGGPGGDGNFVNGDFETGDFTGWTLTQVPANRGSIALDSSGQGGRAGNVARLVAAGDATGTNDVLISQVALAAGTVAPGDSIDVSFDLFGSLTGAGGVVFVEVIFLNGAGQDEGGRNFVGPAAPYVPTTTWTTHSGTVIAGTATNGSQWDVSGGVTLELKTACGAIAGGCGVDASFDNVTFTIN